MRIVIVGAGPAGLYSAYLLRRALPSAHIRVIEQNAADETFGFGVVFSDRALSFLAKDDPDTHAAIAPFLEVWNDITIRHRGSAIAIDGIGFAAIGRLQLLRILLARAKAVGIEPDFGITVETSEALGEVDLIVGADGINSVVRREADFGTSIRWLDNRFAWFGAPLAFPTLTQTFRATPAGHFTAHHYRYARNLSTFIVEVDAETFVRAGFDEQTEEESRATCEAVFAPELRGRPLLTNRSIWRRFPVLRNERWHVGRRVLLGDALHTAHFSIGSGTRLALEDAIALATSFARHGSDVAAALAAFEAVRRPVVEKLVAAAEASAAWYERFPEHMLAEPLAFAHSYVERSGRMSRERLRQIAPGFARQLEAQAA